MLDEHFATFDDSKWAKIDGVPVWDTWLLASNVTIADGGGLRIAGDDTQVIGKYPGGLIVSAQSYLYGYFECRCKLTPEAGTWPAFWLYESNLGDVSGGEFIDEIDIMEYWGGDTYSVNSWVGGAGGSGEIAITNPTSEYHIYACRWTPAQIQFYLDDVLVRTKTNQVPQVAQFVLLDLFMGSVAGVPTPPEAFPCYFDIDYVKVWQVP